MYRSKSSYLLKMCWLADQMLENHKCDEAYKSITSDDEKQLEAVGDAIYWGIRGNGFWEDHIAMAKQEINGKPHLSVFVDLIYQQLAQMQISLIDLLSTQRAQHEEHVFCGFSLNEMRKIQQRQIDEMTSKYEDKIRQLEIECCNYREQIDSLK